MSGIHEFANEVIAKAGALGGHPEADRELLQSVRDVTLEWAPGLTEVYAAALNQDPLTAAVLAELAPEDDLSRIERWLDRILAGGAGPALWADSCLIGYAHAAAGSTIAHSACVSRLLDEHLLSRCVEGFGPDRSLYVYVALKRVLSLTQALIAEAYLEAFATGMRDTGVNDKLADRIRGTAGRKLLQEGRQTLGGA